MDLQTMRILMDINSLQSLGAVQSYAQHSQPTTSLFSTMLGDMLGHSNSLDSNFANLLGTSQLQYTGTNEVFYPAYLKSQLTKDIRTTTMSSEMRTHEVGDYSHIIKKAASKFNLPERLITSVIQHESNFNSRAVSVAGAQGLMQLMPGTAKFLGVTDSFDPEQNITGGARYLRQMLDQFNGNLEHALAAYNAGPGNVKKFGGIPPFQETKNYVQKILSTFNG